MTIAVEGTPQDISTDLTGATPSFSVDVESGCNTAMLNWAFWGGTVPTGINSVTLNGVSPDEQVTVDTATVGSGEGSASGLHLWYDPATGARTLAATFDAAESEGRVALFTCLSGVDHAVGVLDSDTDHNVEGNAVTLTLTGLTAGDVVFKYDQRFADPEVVPSNSAGWTSIATVTNNTEAARLASIVATGSSQACPAEDESYSNVSAAALRAAAEAALSAVAWIKG